MLETIRYRDPKEPRVVGNFVSMTKKHEKTSVENLVKLLKVKYGLSESDIRLRKNNNVTKIELIDNSAYVKAALKIIEEIMYTVTDWANTDIKDKDYERLQEIAKTLRSILNK